ncbi:MAG: hypothetical protein R3B67_01670 [Phycisphaerales bacterium]
MTTDTTLTAEQRARLSVSLSVLLPRTDAIAHEFCAIVEHANPTLRLHMPGNEQIIREGIEHMLGSVCDDDQSEQIARHFAQLGSQAGITESDLPVLLASIQTAIAETAGYTWTDALEDDWTQWFDQFTSWAIQGASLGESQAA